MRPAAASHDPVAIQFVNRVRLPKGPNDPVRYHYIPEFFLERFTQSWKISQLNAHVPKQDREHVGPQGATD